MAQQEFSDSALEAPILNLLREERRKALSAREWKFRLAGFGYGIAEEGDQQFVTRLPQGTKLGVVPAGLH